jgi:hypothetical protein
MSGFRSRVQGEAKEAVMRRSRKVKERADTPRGWSWLSALIGAGVGAVLMKKALSIREQCARGSVGHSEDLMGAERPGFTSEDRSESLAFPTGSRIPPVPPLDDVSTKSH